MRLRARVGVVPGVFQTDSSCENFMKKASSSSSNGIVMKIAVCDGCLQYAEDCECCPECRFSGGHDHGCENATTKRESLVVVRRKTIMGLGEEVPCTIRSPSIVIRVDDVSGVESTGQVPAVHLTLRSRE